MDLETLRQVAGQECLLNPTQMIVVGLSGGPDSLCLVDCLHRLGFPLLAAHLDHGLRPESASDARKVAEIASQMGIEFRTSAQNVAGYALDHHLSIEEAARKLRYRYLFSIAEEIQAQAVAVAHTADDQVETVLMHLLRGTGLNGLKGMAYRAVLPEWHDRIPLVRPLLDTWRDETVNWCREQARSPIQDASNFDTTYFRNRLRHELVPYLQELNPNVKEVIWRMARVLTGENEIVAAAVDRAFADCWLEGDERQIVFSLASFQDLSPGLRRAVLRMAVGRLRRDERDIDFSVVERGLGWLKNPVEGRWVDLMGGLHLWVEWGRIYISEGTTPARRLDCPQLPPGSCLSLSLPGEVSLLNDWILRFERCSLADRTQPGPFYLAGEGIGRLELEAYLDLEQVETPLQLRTPVPGDCLEPLGMEGRHQKLSDFFTNIKLPQRVRGGWPIVESANGIAWVAGLRLTEPYRVTEATRQCLRLTLSKKAQ